MLFWCSMQYLWILIEAKYYKLFIFILQSSLKYNSIYNSNFLEIGYYELKLVKNTNKFDWAIQFYYVKILLNMKLK